MNITKFGAFVNILPGRDGLVHISKLSKLAQGKRVERVEDVLSLGDELEVHVDDIDPIGKVSLSLEDGPSGEAANPGAGGPEAGGTGPGGQEGADGYETVSFEDSWEEEARSTFGDLGPAAAPLEAAPSGGAGRGGRDRNGDQRGQGGPGATRAGATEQPLRARDMAENKARPTRRNTSAKRDVVETTVTDGGLTVVTEHMPDVLSVSLGFWVGTGSVDEPEPIAGASAFPRAPALQRDRGAQRPPDRRSNRCRRW